MALANTACVSRYTPLKPLHPLSGLCEDYAEFSVVLLKQRDQGFSKQASMNIAIYSTGGEQNRAAMTRLYRPVLEILYAEFLLNSTATWASAKLFCEQKLLQSWSPLVNGHYQQAAAVIFACQRHATSETEIETCLQQAIQGGDNLTLPPT